MDEGTGRRTFVVGDVHLTRHTPRAVADDLLRLLERVAGQRLVVAGDFLDLATDAPKAPRQEAVEAVFSAHPALRTGLAEFLERDGELVLLAGNHDAALGEAGAAADVAAALGLRASAGLRLLARPWFLRIGEAHLEHGHLYDPDNAPAHPLVLGAPCLGAHFSAEFLHVTQAHRFLQANDRTPLELFLSAFRWYGPRGFEVMARFFQTAFTALAQAGPFYPGALDRAVGEERLARYAEDAGVPRSVAEAILSVAAPSTLASWPGTFTRLYLDRVVATLALASGAGALAFGAPPRRSGLAALGLGGALMVGSWAAGHDRYGGTVVERLANAAERVADAAGARLVVFGHAHREALEERYANTGSFAWPGDAPGRPYLELVHEPRCRGIRHHLA